MAYFDLSSINPNQEYIYVKKEDRWYMVEYECMNWRKKVEMLNDQIVRLTEKGNELDARYKKLMGDYDKVALENEQLKEQLDDQRYLKQYYKNRLFKLEGKKQDD